MYTMSFYASIGGLLKAHSTEGSYCDSKQLRALIGSGPFFLMCSQPWDWNGWHFLQISTKTHKHLTQTGIKDKVRNQRRTEDIKETTNRSQSQLQIKAHSTDTAWNAQGCIHTGCYRSEHPIWCTEVAMFWIRSFVFVSFQINKKVRTHNS